MQKLIGEETEKALHNFPIPTSRVRLDFMTALVEVKLAASTANGVSGKIAPAHAEAIQAACTRILKNPNDFPELSVLPALQGGAGTSINMNVNELIVAVAKKLTGTQVHSLDDVNASQSTNDALPSALRIACIRKLNLLLATLPKLSKALHVQATKNKKIKKLARTHLQDAVETSWYEIFTSYEEVVKRNQKKLQDMRHFLYELNLAGTAIGNGLNASSQYKQTVFRELKKLTKLPVVPAKNAMSSTSSSADFLTLNQHLVTLYMDLSKIATDFRILASGPNGGIAELRLKELQKGSTIMPGKINPVLPETVNQLYFRISGNTLSVEHACHASCLELSIMFPVIAECSLDSLELAISGVELFTECVKTLTVNAEKSQMNLENSTARQRNGISSMKYGELEQQLKNGTSLVGKA